jgi:hypothetical protein
MPAEPEPTITGTLVSTHIELLRGRFGAAEVAGCIDGLPEGFRREMQGVIAGAWVPVRAYDAFYRAFAQRVGVDVAELHTDISRQSVERTFRTIWRLLLRFTADQALISRTPVLYSRAYSRGTLKAAFPAPGTAEIELEGWPDAPDIVLRGTRIAVETVLRLSGRNAVKIAVERAPDGAKMHATWKV